MRVKKVEYLTEYKLKLTFADHAVKIVDLEPYLIKGVFLPLKDIDYFKQVSIQGHSIAWPNEADFCHDVLYDIGKPIAKAPVIRKRRVAKPPVAPIEARK